LTLIINISKIFLTNLRLWIIYYYNFITHLVMWGETFSWGVDNVEANEWSLTFFDGELPEGALTRHQESEAVLYNEITREREQSKICVDRLTYIQHLASILSGSITYGEFLSLWLVDVKVPYFKDILDACKPIVSQKSVKRKRDRLRSWSWNDEEMMQWITNELQDAVDWVLVEKYKAESIQLANCLSLQMLEDKLPQYRSRVSWIVELIELRRLWLDTQCKKIVGLWVDNMLDMPFDLINLQNNSSRVEHNYSLRDCLPWIMLPKAQWSDKQKRVWDKLLIELKKHIEEHMVSPFTAMPEREPFAVFFEIVRASLYSEKIWQEYKVMRAIPIIEDPEQENEFMLQSDDYIRELLDHPDWDIESSYYHDNDGLASTNHLWGDMKETIEDRVWRDDLSQDEITEYYTHILSDEIWHGWFSWDNKEVRDEVVDRLTTDVLGSDIFDKIQLPFSLWSFEQQDEWTTIPVTFESNSVYQQEQLPQRNISLRYSFQTNDQILIELSEWDSSVLYTWWKSWYFKRVDSTGSQAVSDENKLRIQSAFPEFIVPHGVNKPDDSTWKIVWSFDCMQCSYQNEPMYFDARDANIDSEVESNPNVYDTLYADRELQCIESWFDLEIDTQVYLTASDVLIDLIRSMREWNMVDWMTWTTEINVSKIGSPEELISCLRMFSWSFLWDLIVLQITKQNPDIDKDYIQNNSERYTQNISHIFSNVIEEQAIPLVEEVDESIKSGWFVLAKQSHAYNILLEKASHIQFIDESGNETSPWNLQVFSSIYLDTLNQWIDQTSIAWPLLDIDTSYDWFMNMLKSACIASDLKHIDASTQLVFSDDKEGNSICASIDRYSFETYYTWVSEALMPALTYNVSNILFESSLQAFSTPITWLDSEFEYPEWTSHLPSSYWSEALVHDWTPEANALYQLTDILGTWMGNARFEESEITSSIAQWIMKEVVLLYISGGLLKLWWVWLEALYQSRSVWTKLKAIENICSLKKVHAYVKSSRFADYAHYINYGQAAWKYVVKSWFWWIWFHAIRTSLWYGIGEMDGDQYIESMTHGEWYLHSMVIMWVLWIMPTIAQAWWKASKIRNTQTAVSQEVRAGGEVSVKADQFWINLNRSRVQFPVEMAWMYGVENFLFHPDYIWALRAQHPDASENAIERAALAQSIVWPLMLVAMLKWLHKLPMGKSTKLLDCDYTITRNTLWAEWKIVFEVNLWWGRKNTYKFDGRTKKLFKRTSNENWAHEWKALEKPDTYSETFAFDKSVEDFFINADRYKQLTIAQNINRMDATIWAEPIIEKYLWRRKWKDIKRNDPDRADRMLSIFQHAHDNFNAYKRNGNDIEMISEEFGIPRLEQNQIMAKANYLKSKLLAEWLSRTEIAWIVWETLRTWVCMKSPNISRQSMENAIVQNLENAWYEFEKSEDWTILWVLARPKSPEWVRSREDIINMVRQEHAILVEKIRKEWVEKWEPQRWEKTIEEFNQLTERMLEDLQYIEFSTLVWNLESQNPSLVRQLWTNNFVVLYDTPKRSSELWSRTLYSEYVFSSTGKKPLRALNNNDFSTWDRQSQNGKTQNTPEMIENSGVRNILVVDDVSYSWTQIVESVSSILDSYARYESNNQSFVPPNILIDISLYSQQWLQRLNKLKDDYNQKATATWRKIPEVLLVRNDGELPIRIEDVQINMDQTVWINVARNIDWAVMNDYNSIIRGSVRQWLYESELLQNRQNRKNPDWSYSRGKVKNIKNLLKMLPEPYTKTIDEIFSMEVNARNEYLDNALDELYLRNNALLSDWHIPIVLEPKVPNVASIPPIIFNAVWAKSWWPIPTTDPFYRTAYSGLTLRNVNQQLSTIEWWKWVRSTQE